MIQDDENVKHLLCIIRARANAITKLVEQGKFSNNDPRLISKLLHIADTLDDHVSTNDCEVPFHHQCDLETVCGSYG